jgi:hypothetical protein
MAGRKKPRGKGPRRKNQSTLFVRPLPEALAGPLAEGNDTSDRFDQALLIAYARDFKSPHLASLRLLLRRVHRNGPMSIMNLVRTRL